MNPNHRLPEFVSGTFLSIGHFVMAEMVGNDVAHTVHMACTKRDVLFD